MLLQPTFRLSSALLLLVFSVSPLRAQAIPTVRNASITYTQIDYPGAASTNATGTNILGDVVGTYGLTLGGSCHGFLLHNGHFTSIDYPGAQLTNVNGVNDAGLIVGTAVTDVFLEHAVGFIYDGTNFTTVSYPGVPYTDAQDINNAGDVVGNAGNLYKQVRAFKFSGGQYSFIGPPGHYSNSGAAGINDSGDVVGYAASSTVEDSFLFINGGYRLFPLQSGATTGINNADAIAASTGSGSFVILSGGKRIAIAFPGAPYTQVHRISNTGQVVGFFDSDIADILHGYVTSPVSATSRR